MTEKGCYYCERGEDFQELLFELCDLKVSKVFFCKDQTLPGRCTIMYKDHYEEIYQIPKAERDVYLDDVCALAETIKELYSPDKINYGIYGDTVRHVHVTVCPKYKDKIGWGRPFEMFPENRVFLTEEACRVQMERLKMALLKRRGIE
ncbi:MAG TPA: HIT family protein [Eubacteriales bacterium]|nr:HIT family protein [Eubacteriales bacterium]